MLQGQSHDDVLELCRSVPMDPNLYKRFEFAVSTRSVSAGEVTDQQQDNGTAGVAGSSESLSPGLGAANAVASVETKPQPLAAAPSRLEDEIPKLLCAQESAVPAAALLHAGDVRPATLAPEAIGTNLSALAAVHTRTFEGPALLPVISGVGGAGATTVLAGLGRALSILGERVLLVDARGPSNSTASTSRTRQRPACYSQPPLLHSLKVECTCCAHTQMHPAATRAIRRNSVVPLRACPVTLITFSLEALTGLPLRSSPAHGLAAFACLF